MTRYLLDSLHPDEIPLDAYPGAMIAGYLGHASNPQSYLQAVQRFPGREIVSIASHNAVNAQILDVETGAVDPMDFPTINDWCARQLARGVYPTIYCNTSTWPHVLPHIDVPVNWWAANWSNGPHIPAGAVGVQYGGEPGYDVSIMNDSIKGIDAVSAPSVSDIWNDAIPVPTQWAPSQQTIGGIVYPAGYMPAWWVLSQCLSVVTASLCNESVKPQRLDSISGGGGGISPAQMTTLLESVKITAGQN